MSDARPNLFPPNLFIVGAMKAGTTALHGYLDCHPDIFMSDPKEPGFFADPAPDAAARAAYLSLFARGAGQRWRGEASTRYTKGQGGADVAGRIAEVAPEARILYMVRDPVTRTVSQYLFNRRIHAERRPLCQAVREDPRYRQIGDYTGQITPYLSLFGADRVRILSAERLETDPQAVLDGLFCWLGLPSVPVPQDLRKNTTAGGLRRHGRLTAWLLRAEMEPLRHLVKRAGATGLARRVWDRANPPAPVPVTRAEIAELRVLLAGDIAAQRAGLARLMDGQAPDWPDWPDRDAGDG